LVTGVELRGLILSLPRIRNASAKKWAAANSKETPVGCNCSMAWPKLALSASCIGAAVVLAVGNLPRNLFGI